jgi:hypothetical protein
MKHGILGLAVVIFVSGCSTTKVVETPKPVVVETPKPVVVEPQVVEKPSVPKVGGFKEIEYMQRQEVIQAAKDCIDARMRPIVQNVPQKTEFGTVMLPVLVNCEIYNIQKR